MKLSVNQDSQRTYSPHIRATLLALVLPLLSVADVARAAPSLSIKQTSSTFMQWAGQDAWAQSTVRIKNTSDSAKEARIEYVAVGSRGEERFFRVVSVPANSVRRTTLTVRAGKIVSNTGAPGDKGQDKPQIEETFVLWDLQTHRRVQQSSININAVDPRTTEMCMISPLASDNDSYSYLKQMPDRPLGNIHFLSGRPESLPTKWHGYSIVDVIVMGGVEPWKLRTSQVDAMLDWVRRGGVMVLVGSTAMGELLQGELARAVGAEAVGVHSIASITVSPTHPRKADKKAFQTVTLAAPLPMVELTPTSAEIIFTANDGLPLMTKHRLGEGWVFALATPLGALQDRKLHSLWREVARVRKTVAPIDADEFLGPAKSTLNKIAGRRGPGRSLPAGILAVVALTVMLAGIILGAGGRREIVWAILIPLMLLLAGGLYVVGTAQASNERLSFIGLISALEGDSARVQGVFAYYSGPESQKVTFSADSRRGVIAGVGGTGPAALGGSEIRSGATDALTERLVAANSTTAFSVDAVDRVEGLAGTFAFDESGLSGTLENHLPADITDAIIYVNRRAYRLGRIEADKATRVSIGPGDRLGPGEFTGSLVHTADDGLRNDLLGKIATTPGISRRIAHGPILIGYTSYSPLDPLRARQIDRQGWCIIAWPVKLATVEAGAKVFIPEGFVKLDFEHRGAPIWDAINERFHQSVRGTELLALVHPPEHIGRLTDATAHLKIGIRASNYSLTVSGVTGPAHKSARRTVIERINGPVGVFTVSVPAADRFVDADGRYVFSLKVQRLGGAGGKPFSAEDMAQWKFDGIDVALEGIVP